MTIYNGDWHLREREIKKKYKDVVYTGEDLKLDTP